MSFPGIESFHTCCEDNYYTFVNDHCEKCRIYHQKFMDIHKNPEFQQRVYSQISYNKINIRGLKDYFRESLNAEIFQHELDIGIEVFEAVVKLYHDHKVKIYENDTEITGEITIDLVGSLCGEEKCNVIRV